MKRNLAEFAVYQNTIDGFDDIVSFDEYEAIRDCNYAFLDDTLDDYNTAKDVLNYIFFNDFEINFNELWKIIIRKHPNIMSDTDFIRELTFRFCDDSMFKTIMQGITVDEVKTIFLNKEMVVLSRDNLPGIEDYYGNLFLASTGEVRAVICDFIKKHWCGKYRWFVKEDFNDTVIEMM